MGRQLQEYVLPQKEIYKLLSNLICLFQTVADVADALLNRLGRIIKPRQTTSLLNLGHQLMLPCVFGQQAGKILPLKAVIISLMC